MVGRCHMVGRCRRLDDDHFNYRPRRTSAPPAGALENLPVLFSGRRELRPDRNPPADGDVESSDELFIADVIVAELEMLTPGIAECPAARR